MDGTSAVKLEDNDSKIKPESLMAEKSSCEDTGTAKKMIDERQEELQSSDTRTPTPASLFNESINSQVLSNSRDEFKTGEQSIQENEKQEQDGDVETVQETTKSAATEAGDGSNAPEGQVHIPEIVRENECSTSNLPTDSSPAAAPAATSDNNSKTEQAEVKGKETQENEKHEQDGDETVQETSKSVGNKTEDGETVQETSNVANKAGDGSNPEAPVNNSEVIPENESSTCNLPTDSSPAAAVRSPDNNSKRKGGSDSKRVKKGNSTEQVKKSNSEEREVSKEVEAKSLELKTKGNDLLAKDMFKEAIECYTEGISIDPKNHLLYSNRSAAYMRINSYQEALEDACRCIKLDSSWPKGYGRKVMALSSLQQYEEVIQTYKAALKLGVTTELLQDSYLEASNKLLLKKLVGGCWCGKMPDDYGGLEQFLEFREEWENQLEMECMGESTRAWYKLDATKTPVHLDLRPIVADEVPIQVPYLLEVAPDGMSGRLAPPSEPNTRPRNFKVPTTFAIHKISKEDKKALNGPDPQIAALPKHKQMLLYMHRVTSTLPSEPLEEAKETDDSGEAQRKITTFFRLQTALYKLQKCFPEDITSKCHDWIDMGPEKWDSLSNEGLDGLLATPEIREKALKLYERSKKFGTAGEAAEKVEEIVIDEAEAGSSSHEGLADQLPLILASGAVAIGIMAVAIGIYAFLKKNNP